MNLKRLVHNILFVSLCIWGIVESVLGIFQTVGICAPHNLTFKLTGSFDNPGPYGGLLACIVSTAIAFLLFENESSPNDNETKYLRLVATVCCCFCLIVVPATRSRTAWVALVCSLVAVFFEKYGFRRWVSRYPKLSIASFVIIVLSIPGLFLMKKESALGRLHIWHMDFLTVMDSPWTGHGISKIMAAYGRTQEFFFRECIADASPTVIRIAGCPEYPFNEYLGLGMALGLPAMIVSIIVVSIFSIRLLKEHSAYAGGMISLSIFSLASYPMSLLQFWILLAIIVASSFKASSAWVGVVSSFLVLVGGLLFLKYGYKSKIEECRESYTYGHSLHKLSLWEDSNKELIPAFEYSCDPMFHIIVGKNYESMGRFDLAESEFDKAHFMVPCRIYPLYLKMKLLIKESDIQSAIEIAVQISKMPVNENHLGMVRLKRQSVAVLDSLTTQKCLDNCIQ